MRATEREKSSHVDAYAVVVGNLTHLPDFSPREYVNSKNIRVRSR